MTVDSFAAQISLVVPVKGDFHGLVRLLEQIRNWQIEIIVVEAIAEVAADAPVVINPQREQSMNEVRRREGLWLQHSPSRGAQIRHGIEQASSPWLWVLHADTHGDDAAYRYLQKLVQEDAECWGRFDVHLAGAHWGLPLVAWAMNWRSRFTRICTGDQGMFFHRRMLAAVGGFPQQPLMEDVEVSRRLRKLSRSVFRAPRITISTSAARWDQQGWLRTILHMWWLRIRYALGASPEELAAAYYPGSRSRQSPPAKANSK